MPPALPSRLLLLAAVVLSTLSAQQPTRVVVDNLKDLQMCLNQPAGGPLVCALRSSSTPYAVSGQPLIIKRSDTTVEGAIEASEDPPTLRRTDPALTKMIWVQRMASNVTIKNLQFDGNKTIVPKSGNEDIFIDGSNATVSNNIFGESSYYCVYFGGPHASIHDNTFGQLRAAGADHSAPGIGAAIKCWGKGATEFSIDSNKISDYRGGMSITGVPNGSDPATASVISNNTLYHDATCVPDCGGGQIYLAGSSNIKVTNNTLDGGWNESENHDTVHSYGIEIDDHASYIYTSGNKIFNNSISGIWIGNGAHHIVIENDNIYNNGLNGVQIAGTGSLAPVTDVSMIGVTANHNDLHRSARAPYPTLPRFWGVMIQNGKADGSVCIQTDSNLGVNAKGAIYADSHGAYSKSPACPRPYN